MLKRRKHDESSDRLNDPEIQERLKELPQYFADHVTRMMTEVARDPRFSDLTSEETR